MAYQRTGKLPPGALLKFYFGSEDMCFGLPPTAKALEAYLEMIEGSGLPWLVSSFGDDCVGCGIAEEAIIRIAQLYGVGKEVRGQSPEARVALRQSKTKPIFDNLEE